MVETSHLQNRIVREIPSSSDMKQNIYIYIWSSSSTHGSLSEKYGYLQLKMPPGFWPGKTLDRLNVDVHVKPWQLPLGFPKCNCLQPKWPWVCHVKSPYCCTVWKKKEEHVIYMNLKHWQRTHVQRNMVPNERPHNPTPQRYFSFSKVHR